MLLRALYDHVGKHRKTLTFKENDKFILLCGPTGYKAWWLVINDVGEMGYVPSNYMEKFEATGNEIVEILDGGIESIHLKAAENNGFYSEEQKESLQNLVQLRKNYKKVGHLTVEVDQLKQRCPSPKPAETHLSQKKHNSGSSDEQLLQKSSKAELELEPNTAEAQALRFGHVFKSTRTNSCDGDARRELGENSVLCEIISKKSESLDCKSISHELVESVRVSTQLSYNLSRKAVEVIITHLKEDIPFLKTPMEKLLNNLSESCHVSESKIETTLDAQRLRIIFEELLSCKNDEQQRSWALHEDEPIIVEYLEELLSILNNADPTVSKHVFAADGYDYVLNLVAYYQMEPRRLIRIVLLQIFGALCGIDQDIIPMFAYTILPMELARDMLASGSDFRKLSYSALVLTMILSRSDPLPFHYFEFLNERFVSFILNTIEETIECDTEEKLPDLFIALILAFNLQFKEPTQNFVLNTLQIQNSTKVFLEKILLLINRGDDPANVLELEKSPTNSVLKLFLDIFSNKNTSSLFYTNDLHVLIDIIVRHLADLPPEDKRRELFLLLCQKVIRYSNYSDHNHRQQDLIQCFRRILKEESLICESISDKNLVKAICQEFPEFFSFSDLVGF